MKLNSTYLIDKYLGETILMPFSWMAKLTSFGKTPPQSDPPRTVLVAKFLGLGSIVHTLPLLQKIRKTYPNCRIVFLSFKKNAPFLRLLKLIDETILIDTSGAIRFPGEILRAAGRMRKLNVDYFLDLEFYSRFSVIMGLLSGAKYHVGFHAVSFPRRASLLTHRIRLNYQRHISTSFLSFFDAMSFALGPDRIVKSVAHEQSLPDPEITLALTPRDKEEWAAAKSKLGITGDYLVFSPTASSLWFRLKQWPDQHWRDLAVTLKQKTGLPIVGVGGPGDKKMLEDVFGDLALNSAGMLSFSGYLSLLQGASLIIAVESGPAYLADLLRRPVIALFGPGTPRLEGVKGEKTRNISLGLACSPCPHALETKRVDCEDNLCMKGITADVVAREALHLLDRGGAPNISNPHLTEVAH